MRMLRTAFAVLVISICAPAKAQDYPAKSITIIVPYPPGGGVDALGRGIADQLSKRWSQPVIIENRAGASTIVGTELVARANPDGYVLLLTTDASITSNPHFFPNRPYNPMRDLDPISEIASFDLMVLAHPSVKATSVADLVEVAKKPAPPLNYASFGNASQSHVFFEALAVSKGLALAHVPYRGIAPSLQAVVAGEVHLSMAGTGSANEFVTSGRLRAFAIARKSRHPLLPGVPTFEEAGLADLDPKPWFGLFAPRATSREVKLKLWGEIAKFSREPEFRQKFIDPRGYELTLSSPDDFAKSLVAELAMRGQQIKLSGVKPD